jgi:hypothetical protein
MHESLVAGGADLVYAGTTRHAPGRAARKGQAPVPAPCLLVQGTVPLGSYAARVDALRNARLLFDERIREGADREFLVRALGSGLRFHAIEDVLLESRDMDCDDDVRAPNAAERSLDPGDLVRCSALRAAQQLGRGRLLAQMLEFPSYLLEGLETEARDVVLAARSFIDASGTASVASERREVAS